MNSGNRPVVWPVAVIAGLVAVALVWFAISSAMQAERELASSVTESPR